MFTGIVEEAGQVVSFQLGTEAWKLVVAADQVCAGTAVGDSVAVNGCCLTVVQAVGRHLQFDVLEDDVTLVVAGEFVPADGEVIDRGATIALNLYDAAGHFIDHRTVERRANEAGISLRTGCFCNPGGGEVALGLSADELSTCFVNAADRLALDEFRRCIDDKSTGAVRVSLGLVTTFADVYRFVAFVAGLGNKTSAQV